MTTLNSYSPSPEDSKTAPDPSKKYSPLERRNHLADHARATAGILTPTETLELVDLAEYYQSQFTACKEDLEQALWDLEHPTLKYL